MNEIKNVTKYLKKHTNLDVWHILSAMRGPDRSPVKSISNFELKSATTAIIRHKIYGDDFWCLSHRDTALYLSVRQKLTKYYERQLEKEGFKDHFIAHAMLAFKSLDLKWDEIND